MVDSSPGPACVDPDEGIPHFQTDAERDAYLIGVADGHSAGRRELLDRPPTVEFEQSLRDAIRDSARLLFEDEALRHLDQVGPDLAAVLAEVALERRRRDLVRGDRPVPPTAWAIRLRDKAGAAVSMSSEMSAPAEAEGPHRTALYEAPVDTAAEAVGWAVQIRRDLEITLP